MYVDSRNGTSYDLGTIHTPYLHDAAGTCRVVFYYHMYGYGIGRLNVVLNTGYRETLVWSMSYEQGDVWKKGVIDLGRIPTEFRIAFKGRRGYSTNGDIAIDDVSFEDCDVPQPQPSCSAGYFRCDSRACVLSSRICDFTDDCGDNSDENTTVCATYERCSFESGGICNWTHENADLRWTVYQDSTSSLDTGPSRDHTTGLNSGYYMFVESSYPQVQNDKARISSVGFQATSGDCYLR